MNMKRMLALILALIMVFALVGCNKATPVTVSGIGGGRPLVGEDKVYVETPFVENLDIKSPRSAGFTQNGELLVLSIEEPDYEAYQKELEKDPNYKPSVPEPLADDAADEEALKNAENEETSVPEETKAPDQSETTPPAAEGDTAEPGTEGEVDSEVPNMSDIQYPRPRIIMTYFDKQGKQLRQIKTDELEWPNEMNVLSDHVMFTTWGEAGQKICNLSFDGKITDGPKLPENLDSWGMKVGVDGSIFVRGNEGITIINDKGEITSTIKVENLNNFSPDSKGKLHCLSWGEKGNIYATYDIKTGNEISSVSMPQTSSEYIQDIRELAPGKVYAIMSSSLRPMMEDGTIGDAILSTEGTSLTIPNSSIINCAMDPVDESLIYMVSEYRYTNYLSGIRDYTNNENMRFVKFVLDDANKYAGKKILRVGVMWRSQEISFAATVFENNNPDWKVVIEDYSAGFDYSRDDYMEQQKQMMQKVGADLLTGKGADVLMVSGLPYERYAEKNVLEDLSKYIARDLPADKYFTHIIDALNINGKPYVLPTGFQFSLLYGLKGNLPDEGHSLSFTDFMTYVRAMPEGSKALEIYSDEKTQVGAFQIFLPYFLNDFMDLRTKKVNFDSPEFRTLCADLEELSTKYAHNPNQGYRTESSVSSSSSAVLAAPVADEYVSPQDMLERKTLGYIQGYSGGFSDLRENYARFGEDMRYSFMPSMEEGKNLFNASNLLGINATAPDKEMAWQFLMTLMQPKVQNAMYGIPMDRSIVQGWVDRLLNPTEDDKKYDNGMIWVNGAERKANPLTKELLDEYMAAIESLNATISYDNTAIAILQEEIQPYLEGTKKIEDVIPSIQNRISTYVNE